MSGPPDDERLEDLVRSGPAPIARPEFQRELRARFVGGRLAPDAATPDPDAAAPPLRPDRRRWRTNRAPRRQRPWLLGAALAAAAGIVAFVAWDRSRAAPGWRVLAPAGTALVADGAPRTVAPEGLDLAPDTLSVQALDEPIRLAFGRHVVLECVPGTRLDLVRATSAGGRFDLALHAGELRVATGPDFPGARLAIRTPSARVDVVGTQFLVDLRGDGLCVCIREGRVGVTVGGERHELGQATMHTFLDATGERVAGVPPAHHVEALSDLAGFWRR